MATLQSVVEFLSVTSFACGVVECLLVTSFQNVVVNLVVEVTAVKVTLLSKSYFDVGFSFSNLCSVEWYMQGRDVPYFNGCCICKHHDEFSSVSFFFGVFIS